MTMTMNDDGGHWRGILSVPKESAESLTVSFGLYGGCRCLALSFLLFLPFFVVVVVVVVYC